MSVGIVSVGKENVKYDVISVVFFAREKKKTYFCHPI